MPDTPDALEAGRLDVPVVADLTGFAEKLRAGVEAAAKRVQADIGVTINSAGLRKRLQQVVKTSSTNVNAHVGVKWDTAGLRRRLQTAVAASSSNVNADVGVRADTSLLQGELRSEVLAASGLISADIDVHVNAPGLRDEIRKAAQIASEGITAFIGMNIDGTGLREEIQAWARIASQGVKANIDVDVDDAQAAAEGQKAERVAEAAAGDINTELDVDTAKAAAKIAAVKAKAKEGNVQLGAFDATPFERFLFRIQQFTLQVGVLTTIGAALEGIGSALTGIVGGLAAAVGGLYALTAAAAPAVATLAVIPNLLLAAGQGLGVLIGGFLGVGQAIGALRQQQQATTSASTTAAADTAEAARAQADAQRNAARQVETATRNLARAQENARLAQKNLNDARKEAKERLQDLSLELVSAAIDEESAAIGLERAKERLAETQANPFATPLDVREAELAYQQALHQVDVVAERNEDLAREGGELRARGVERSEQVIAAKRALRDANLSVLDAERALADAHRNVARVQQQAAKPAAALAAANQAVEDAFRDLSPEAQSFARFVVNELIPAFIELRNEIAARLLPAVEDGLRRLLNSPLWKTLRDELLETADGAAAWFTDLVEILEAPVFARDIKIISDGNQRALEGFGNAALSLFNTLVDIAVVVAQPDGLLDRFTEWVEQLTAGWEEAAKLNRENGSMFRFFDRAADRLGQVVRIFKNLAIGLYQIGQAGVGAGDDLLDYWEKSSRRFIRWTEDNREKLEAWFDVVKGITIDIAALLVDITKGIAKLADDPNTVRMVQLLRDEVGPAIGRFVQALQDSDVGQKFSDLITSVVDALTTLTESGGLGILLDFLRGFFDAIVAIGRTEGGAKFLSFLLTLIGISGALSLTAGVLIRLGTGFFRIGKGLKAAATWLLSGRFMAAMKTLAGIFGLGGIAAATKGPGGLAQAGITGQLATIIAKMDIIIARMGAGGGGGPGGVVTGGKPSKPSRVRTILRKGLRGATGAGTALFLGDIAVDWLNENFDNGSYDAGDWWGNVLAQAGVGAATGAGAGSVFGGVGAVPGAIIGTIIGALSGVKNSANKQADYERLRRLDPVTEVLFSQKGVTPEEASKSTRKALREIAAEAYTTNREYLGYADSVEQAQVAIDDHYRVLKTAIMETTGLTEAEVESLIGTIADYNAEKILPKRLTAVDNVSPAIEQTGRNLAAYAEQNPPPKTLVAQDQVTDKAERVRVKLDELDKKRVAPKDLDARDRATAKADRVLTKITQLDRRNVEAKEFQANDRVTPVLTGKVFPSITSFNQTRIRPKFLEFRTNVAEISDYIRRVVNSIPNTIPKNIALGITMRGANLTALAQAYASGYRPYGMATGGTVLPQLGGTVVRLAEAGRPETVVDTGTVNELLAEVTEMLRRQATTSGVYVADGAIRQTVYNPVPEKASESLSRRMRQAAEFGLAGIG